MLICTLTFELASGQDKLNADPVEFSFNLSVDASWRLVSREEYEKQNPRGLNVLRTPELKCLHSYVHKDSLNIMNPPGIVFQLAEVPDEVLSIKDIRAEADSVFSSGAIRRKASNKDGRDAARLWNSILSRNKTYYDEDMNVLITVASVPGKSGAANIIYSASYFGKGHIANIKLISPDGVDPKPILSKFINMIYASGFLPEYRLK